MAFCCFVLGFLGVVVKVIQLRVKGIIKLLDELLQTTKLSSTKESGILKSVFVQCLKTRFSNIYKILQS